MKAADESDALRNARDAVHACHRSISAAVDRGDMKATERHTAEYLAAEAALNRVERDLIDNWKPAHGSR